MDPLSDRRWFEMRWSGRLRNLGFTMEQIVRCWSTDDARVLVPGSIRGEPVQFVFATNTGWECYLYQSYVERRGLPVFRTADDRARAVVGELSVFGLTREVQAAPISDGWPGWEPPLAGRVGSYFLSDSVVAVDASVPAIAVAPAGQRPSLAGALCRLPFIPKAWKGRSFTNAVRDAVFAIDYEWPSSVTKAYLATQRLKPGRNGKAEVELCLPGDITVTQQVQVVDTASAAPLADTGITRCDGTLGSDLWCRWITVFDFSAGELLLFPYD
jgi:hypothetical protein